MTTAYVLVEVKPGLDEKVLSTIRGIEGVNEAHFVMGSYDIIALVDNSRNLRVIEKIRSLEGVKHTYTLILVEGGTDRDSSA